MNAREKKLVDAARKAIPWLILLGDYIGNGTPAYPNGRCDAILALREALPDDFDSAMGEIGGGSRAVLYTDSDIRSLLDGERSTEWGSVAHLRAAAFQRGMRSGPTNAIESVLAFLRAAVKP